MEEKYYWLVEIDKELWFWDSTKRHTEREVADRTRGYRHKVALDIASSAQINSITYKEIHKVERCYFE